MWLLIPAAGLVTASAGIVLVLLRQTPDPDQDQRTKEEA